MHPCTPFFAQACSVYVLTFHLPTPQAKHGRVPRPADAADASELVSLAKPLVEGGEVDEALLGLLAHNASGELSPMAAMFGGMVGQEVRGRTRSGGCTRGLTRRTSLCVVAVCMVQLSCVCVANAYHAIACKCIASVTGSIEPPLLGDAPQVVKAVSGKFHPLFQWFYFDSCESLPSQLLPADSYAPAGGRYDRQIAVFGRELQAKLQSLQLFLVGAGALGCEFLKNFACMGAACGADGKLTVTDDDVIEKSNLSRQFLFRDWNIGSAKSTVAADVRACLICTCMCMLDLHFVIRTWRSFRVEH